MRFNMADIGAFHCYQAELIIIITINSSFKTGTGSRYTGCITHPLSHRRKLISCQLAIFLPLKSLAVMLLCDVIDHENQSQHYPDHRYLCLELFGRITTLDEFSYHT